MAPRVSHQALINICMFRYTSLDSLEWQLSSEIAQSKDVNITANELLKYLQQLEKLADDKASCPLADVQTLLNDASSVQKWKKLLLKQIRRYKKYYFGRQIDDSSSQSTLLLPSHTVQAIKRFPLWTSTLKICTTFLRQSFVLILPQQRCNLSRLYFASQSATTTLLKEYTLRQRAQSRCNSSMTITSTKMWWYIRSTWFLWEPRILWNLYIHWIYHYNRYRQLLIVATCTLWIDRVQDLGLQSITAFAVLFKTQATTLFITTSQISSFLISSCQR